ncbi:MAG: bacteriophage abortive infection AbiH family protein [Turicibacter sp.]|nr:bacteriophage abortive infection AbiH family protein [Turicibacter sp.]
MAVKNSQLIILGNGFDLSCGLKSSYKDFFEWHFKDTIEEEKRLNEKNTYGSYQSFDLAFDMENNWDKIFWSKKPSETYRYWADIESVIKETVETIREKETEFFTRAFSDLYLLEDRFIEFMNHQLSTCKDYRANAHQLLGELVVSEYIFRPLDFRFERQDYYKARNEFIDNKENATEILSFNYTNQFNFRSFANPRIFRNVHGSLADKNIIFGIDGHKLNNPLTVGFTKTYRIMTHQKIGFEISPDIQYIKFFGHGLAEADYSYFQSIFDGVGLYGGKTKLIFYYNNYNSNQARDILENQQKAVHQLIQIYGTTLDNEDHGSNLLHKLLLEGRLEIKELSVKSIIEEK